MKPLDNDEPRCYGNACGRKWRCMRFRTVPLDPPLSDEGKAVIRPYRLMLCSENFEYFIGAEDDN